MPDLVLGPLLRHVGTDDANVWVETSAPCQVEILGCASTTFRVGMHHYALVHVTGLSPGVAREYEVRLDGALVWPLPESGFPASVVRPMENGEAVKLVFGSCRISAPHEAPYTSSIEEDERGLGVDALYAMAMRLKGRPPEELPNALVMLGDQIYAHKPPFDTLDFIKERRDTDNPPGEAVSDFDEYARIYRDSWGDPAIRWLLSTVPSAMIFDDHEVDDDWNISEAWVEKMRREPYWNDQIAGGHVSYLIYQHLGNLPPEELRHNDLYNEILAADDAWPILRDEAHKAHRDSTVARWSFHRDFGGVRLVMIDSRGGRVLDEGRRAMVDAEEWTWIEEKATGGFDHLLIGTSLPPFLGPGMHHLQSLNERLCSGAFGPRIATWAEGVRRSQDLDHWASFGDSFAALTERLRSVATGEKGEAPASIVVLSGDVHHGYLAEATFDGGTESRVYGAVSSALRNALPGKKSRLQRNAWKPTHALAARGLARLLGVKRQPLNWRLTHDAPFFDNQVATLELDGRHATVTFEKAVLDASNEPDLEKLYTKRLV